MTDPRAPSPALETIQTKLANGALDEAGTLIDELLVDFASDPNLAYLNALRYRLSGNAAKALQCPASKCIVIEDALKGLSASKAAGMSCIIICNRLNQNIDFSEADLIFSSLSDFLTTIKLCSNLR